jgi:galactose-1-phosphate uridylyltransferase
VRRVKARRAGRAVVCDIALAEHADVKTLTAWLKRGDKLLGADTMRHPGRHAHMRIKPAKRLRHGHYELLVIAADKHGDQSSKLARITLR